MRFSDLVKASNDPKVTFFIPTSRGWVFDRFREQLLAAQLPYSTTELVVLLDSDSEALRQQWLDLLRLMRLEKPWNGIRLYTTGNKPLPDDAWIHHRRDRIIDLHEQAKELIGKTEHIYSLEDDTFVEPDTYSRLVGRLREGVGLVTAVEAGRWDIKMVGVWEIEEEDGKPVTVRTKLPPAEPIVENIQGAGWYCFITPTALFKSIQRRSEGECWGPDVCYCYDITRQGFEALVDWSIHCGHLTDKGEMILPDGHIRQLEWKNFDGKWFRGKEATKPGRKNADRPHSRPAR